MEIINYIVDNALILIPALVIIGAIVKHIQVIPNKWIPLILLVFGIGGTMALMGLTADAVIQGVLVTGAAVYGNQLVKQLGKVD
jgi:hypothetical protein